MKHDFTVGLVLIVMHSHLYLKHDGSHLNIFFAATGLLFLARGILGGRNEP